jgi:hypothetical protein
MMNGSKPWARVLELEGRVSRKYLASHVTHVALRAPFDEPSKFLYYYGWEPYPPLPAINNHSKRSGQNLLGFSGPLGVCPMAVAARIWPRLLRHSCRGDALS